MNKQNEINNTAILSKEFSSALAKCYSQALSKKVNEAMDKKAEMGWWPTNHLPLGYVVIKLVDKEIKRTIGLDPKEINKKIVLREFELRAKGLSFDKIKETILKEKLLTPEMAKKYTVKQISGRIKNSFYRGEFLWKGKLYQGKHKLFVPKEWLEIVDSDSRKAG
jgi:site-specific DNA recombinase